MIKKIINYIKDPLFKIIYVNNSVNTGDNVSTSPYRAMGNMNTVISNPSVNINNTMDVNIASAGTNNDSLNTSSEVDNNLVNDTTNTPPTIQTNAYIPGSDEGSVKRTYVSNDNKPKKRTISLNLGKEFKIALLIIVVLLIFIFLLPLLPQFF